VLATRSQGIYSRCSSPLCRRLDCFARGRASGAPASIPKRSGLTARFASTGAVSQPGRGPTSHTAHRGATSVRMERATGSICPGDVITRIVGRPKPFDCVGALPGILSSGPVSQGVAETASLGPSLEQPPPSYEGRQIPQAPIFLRRHARCVCYVEDVATQRTGENAEFSTSCGCVQNAHAHPFHRIRVFPNDRSRRHWDR
jgi:hypothetical protein